MKKKLKTKILFSLVLLSIGLSGCKSKAIRTENSSNSTFPAEAATETKPVTNPEIAAITEPQKNEKLEAIKDGVVLVLGPGLARSMAFIGVIKALEENNIPIKGITAVEFSSILASIWASSSSNTLEWEIHKFKKDTLLDSSFFTFRKQLAPGEKIQKFIENAVKVSSLDKMKIPLVVGFVKADALQAVKTGPSKEILRSSVGVQGLLETYSYEGQDSQSAIIESPLLISQAKELGVGPTLCLDVLSLGENYKTKDAKEEQLINLMKSVKVNVKNLLSQCDHKILIPVKNIGYLDFDKKAELIFMGKREFKNWAEQK